MAPQRKLANEKPKGETVDYDTLDQVVAGDAAQALNFQMFTKAGENPAFLWISPQSL